MPINKFIYSLSETYFKIMPLVFLICIYEIYIENQNLLRQKEQELFEKEKHILQLQIQNQALEKQKIEVEYNYLRAQINPPYYLIHLVFFIVK